ALVNIGPVHHERIKSLDNIVSAKREIFESASTCVINTDAHGLRAVADELSAAGKRVIRVSTIDRDADATVVTEGSGFAVIVAGEPIANVSDSSAPVSNVAGAVGLALALSIPVEVIARRVVDLPGSDHRQSVATGASGAVVIDNTFSSNPASAEASLKLLAKLHHDAGGTGRTMVVTPGMVELGSAQFDENEAFASRASTQVDEFLIVGQTNRAALRHGATAGTTNVHCFATRVDAVEWVRANAGPGDVVLYEGDLPDHYP
ncbi:MAG: Mur ligase family protein, partial [Acidimicrobiia bacterium]